VSKRLAIKLNSRKFGLTRNYSSSRIFGRSGRKFGRISLMTVCSYFLENRVIFGETVGLLSAILFSRMDKIGFRIQPSPIVDDYEVRILVSGKDIIPRGMTGLDPVQGLEVEGLLSQTALTEGGRLWFARGDYETDEGAYLQVSRAESAVIWNLEDAGNPTFAFNAREYDEAISRLREDFSWETPKRTAERLIKNLDYSALNKYGIKFLNASARWWNSEKIAVSFWLTDESAIEYQLVCHVAWDQSNAQGAADNVENLLRQAPEQWSDVVCYPQVPYKLHLIPSIAGPGWRSGSPN
jgi:hypothetical protein